ncbi:MAG: hypothetical protein R2857_14475 [Vampirovibrionales bacterium]
MAYQYYRYWNDLEYYQPKAIARAYPHFEAWLSYKQLNPVLFEGPYLTKVRGTSIFKYVVCYRTKQELYVYCWDDFTRQEETLDFTLPDKPDTVKAKETTLWYDINRSLYYPDLKVQIESDLETSPVNLPLKKKATVAYVDGFRSKVCNKMAQALSYNNYNQCP